MHAVRALSSRSPQDLSSKREPRHRLHAMGSPASPQPEDPQARSIPGSGIRLDAVIWYIDTVISPNNDWRQAMASKSCLHRVALAAATAVAGGCLGTAALAAAPKVVTAANSDPKCFAPWAGDTKLFQYPAKKGPYRIALANGYVANTWRIQMIKTAKAYAAQPDVAAK